MRAKRDGDIVTLCIMILLVLMAAVMINSVVAKAETVMYVDVAEGSHLNARAKPNRHSEIEAILHAGEEVTVLETRDGWGKVPVMGMELWVKMEYLREGPVMSQALILTVESD